MTLPQFLPIQSVQCSSSSGAELPVSASIPSFAKPLAFATLRDGCLCVYQSDLPVPVLVALAQGSRQPNALSFSLLSSKAAHHHGSLGRRFPSFH